MIWLKAFTSFWTKKILSWASEAINNIIFQPKVGFKEVYSSCTRTPEKVTGTVLIK